MGTEEFWVFLECTKGMNPAFFEQEGTPALNFEAFPRTAIQIVSPQFENPSLLSGLKCDVLHLCHTRVSDLRPLRNCQFKQLCLAGCPVSDLNPLKETSIRELIIVRTPVTDLSPLLELPLTFLHLNESATRVEDLNRIATLKNLTVPRGAGYLQDLRKLNQLERLSHERVDRDAGYTESTQTVEEFWKGNPLSAGSR